MNPFENSSKPYNPELSIARHIQDLPVSVSGNVDHSRQQVSPEELLKQQEALYLQALSELNNNNNATAYYKEASGAYDQITDDIQKDRGHADDLVVCSADLGIGIKDYAKQIHHGVSEIIKKGSDIFSITAVYFDPLVWKEVQDEVKDYGVDSQYVETLLDRASSPEARRAMVLAMDSKVWKEVQDEVKDYGVDSQYVETLLDRASSPEARRAMVLAMDSKVWKEVQDEVKDYGVDSQYVETLLDRASSPEARRAMVLAMDSKVWKEVQDEVKDYGVDSQYVETLLDRASSEGAKEIMRWSLGRPNTNDAKERLGKLSAQFMLPTYFQADTVVTQQTHTAETPGQLIDTGTTNKAIGDGAQDAVIPEGWNFTAPKRSVRRWQTIIKQSGRVVTKPLTEDPDTRPQA